jgi:hypothetical protein
MGSNSGHQVNSNMVIGGRSQYSQVEESGKPCADLWRNPWRATAGLAMWVLEFQSGYLE